MVLLSADLPLRTAELFFKLLVGLIENCTWLVGVAVALHNDFAADMYLAICPVIVALALNCDMWLNGTAEIFADIVLRAVRNLSAQAFVNIQLVAAYGYFHGGCGFPFPRLYSWLGSPGR